MSRVIDLRSGFRLKVERQNDNIAAKCLRAPPFDGFERHHGQRMSCILSGTGMRTRIQMSCGLMSGYTLIPRLIFGCHLCCALRSHVRVRAEASPYCCRLVLMSVRKGFTEHLHIKTYPKRLKAFCKSLTFYNPSALFVR